LNRPGRRAWQIKGQNSFSYRSVAAVYLAVIEPIKEAGMQDYRLDAIKRPERHPAAVDRLTGGSCQSSVSYSGGELPGSKVDGRRGPIAPLTRLSGHRVTLVIRRRDSLTIVFPG
jgi:hypothetical protein